MTESLADGPDWHLRSWFSFWSFTFLRCRHMKRLLNSFPPWIQFLRMRSCGGSMWICKNVSPIHQVYPKCLAALLCGAEIRKNASKSRTLQTTTDWLTDSLLDRSNRLVLGVLLWAALPSVTLPISWSDDWDNVGEGTRWVCWGSLKAMKLGS